MQEPHFFGMATMGEKGQIVIPAEARQIMNLDKGTKLLVTSGPHGVLVLMQASRLQEITKKMNDRLSQMNSLLQQESDDEQETK